jgi:hypothetical protein
MIMAFQMWRELYCFVAQKQTNVLSVRLTCLLLLKSANEAEVTSWHTFCREVEAERIHCSYCLKPRHQQTARVAGTQCCPRTLPLELYRPHPYLGILAQSRLKREVQPACHSFPTGAPAGATVRPLFDLAYPRAFIRHHYHLSRAVVPRRFPDELLRSFVEFCGI